MPCRNDGAFDALSSNDNFSPKSGKPQSIDSNASACASSLGSRACAWFSFSGKLHRSGHFQAGPMRVEWRREECRWEKRKTRARSWSACVRPCRPTMSRAIIRRRCTARHAAGGSAMPTPRTKSGIRACCRLEKRVARRRSDPGGTAYRGKLLRLDKCFPETDGSTQLSLITTFLDGNRWHSYAFVEVLLCD
jgi:hypothetical protein